MKIPAKKSTDRPQSAFFSVSLRPSRLALCCHSLGVLAALLAAGQVARLLVWPLVILALSLGWAGWYHWSRQTSRTWVFSRRRCLQIHNGAEASAIRAIEVRHNWQLLPLWQQLLYRRAGERRWRSLLVWPDSSSPESRRRLRTLNASQTLSDG